MNKKTKLPWVLGTGGLIGGALASWLAPSMIKWYFTPPAQFGINCADPIVWALKRFQWSQYGGAFAGALVALVLYIKIRGPAASNDEGDPKEPTL